LSGSSSQEFSPQQEEAISLAREKYPELRRISKRPPNIISRSAEILVQDRDDGWNIVFEKRSGGCPSGCINHHYWVHID